jgi:hypothetical protein
MCKNEAFHIKGFILNNKPKVLPAKKMIIFVIAKIPTGMTEGKF